MLDRLDDLLLMLAVGGLFIAIGWGVFIGLPKLFRIIDRFGGD